MKPGALPQSASESVVAFIGSLAPATAICAAVSALWRLGLQFTYTYGFLFAWGSEAAAIVTGQMLLAFSYLTATAPPTPAAVAVLATAWTAWTAALSVAVLSIHFHEERVGWIKALASVPVAICAVVAVVVVFHHPLPDRTAIALARTAAVLPLPTASIFAWWVAGGYRRHSTVEERPVALKAVSVLQLVAMVGAVVTLEVPSTAGSALAAVVAVASYELGHTWRFSFKAAAAVAPVTEYEAVPEPVQ